MEEYGLNIFTKKLGLKNKEQDLSGYVPYTGATATLAMGVYPIQTSGIYNTGDLKLQVDSNGDVVLFDGADVGDTEDGKSLYIHRKAAEGDGSIRIYIDKWQQGHINGPGTLQIDGFNNIWLQGNGTTYLDAPTTLIGQSWGDANRVLRHTGYITASATQKYIQWKVDDTDDYFKLTREDANILGFKIDMPVDLVDNNLTTTGDITCDTLNYTTLNPPIDLSAYFHKTNDDTDDIIDTATNRFVTDTQISNWNTAYGWGDHSVEGYLKNIVEDTTPQLGGNLDGQSYDITTTGTGTFGKGIFDVTDSEAFLVRKDGDSGDTFVVDTTNTRLGFNATPSHLYSVAMYSPQSTDPFDRTGGGFFMRAGKGYSISTNLGGTGGKFELEGGAGGTANWGLMIKTGGDGGILKLRGGVGGNAEGTGNLRGGDGGNLQLVGGNKGYGATVDGDGGDVEIVSGLGVTHGEIRLIIGDFAGTTILTGLSDGSGIQQDDNIKHYFGTGEDASIYYDGTDLIVNPQEVGSGNFVCSNGAFEGNHNSSDGTSGATGTITVASTTSITVKDGLITAWA